jgi:hypothetical protein
MMRWMAMARRGGPERGRPFGAKSGNPALAPGQIISICATPHYRVSPLLASPLPC